MFISVDKKETIMVQKSDQKYVWSRSNGYGIAEGKKDR